MWHAKSEIGVNNRRRGWNEDAIKKKTQSFHADQCAEFGGGNGTLSWVGAVICVRRRGGGCPDMLPEPRLLWICLTITYPHSWVTFQADFSVPSADLPLCYSLLIVVVVVIIAGCCLTFICASSCRSRCTNDRQEQSLWVEKDGSTNCWPGIYTTTIHGVVTLEAQKLDAIISKYDIVFFGSRAMWEVDPKRRCFKGRLQWLAAWRLGGGWFCRLSNPPLALEPPPSLYRHLHKSCRVSSPRANCSRLRQA